MYEYPYPYDQPMWTLVDQRYFNNLYTKYRYPLTRIPELYRYIIEAGKINTFEAEYEQYQASLNA